MKKIQKSEQKYLEHLAVEYTKELRKGFHENKMTIKCQEIEHQLQTFFFDLINQQKNISELLNQIYKGMNLTTEEKAYLRENVIKNFSHISFRNQKNEMYIIDILGIPCYGDPQESLKISSSMKKQLEQLAVNTQYVSAKIDFHVLSQYPLQKDALCDTQVLSVLGTMLSEVYLNNSTSVPKKDRIFREIIDEVEKSLNAFRCESSSLGYIIPCLSIYKGTLEEYKKLTYFSKNWETTSSIKKIVGQSLWVSATNCLFKQNQIKIKCRPPVQPLIAFGQTLAWETVMSTYEKKNDFFHHINFESQTEESYVLTTYNQEDQIIVQSQPISLFEIISAPNEFYDLLQEECQFLEKKVM